MRPATWNLRLALRYALFAAMETCWLFPILAMLSGWMNLTRVPTAPALFAAYGIAIIVGRRLPSRNESWAKLQLIAVGIAMLVLLVVVRVDLYSNLAPWDFSWLLYFFRALFFLGRFSEEHLAAFAVTFFFMRGLNYATRPLTLWFVGFQFRLGVVILFVLLTISSFLNQPDVSAWVFLYFFVSLLTIALARLDEVGGDIRYGPRWAITLIAGVAVALFLGVALMQVLTLDGVNTVLRFFTPLWMILGLLFFIILIPAGYIVGLLLDLLRPLIQNISRMLDQFQNLFPPNPPEKIQETLEPNRLAEALIPIAQVLFVLGVILLAGYLIARALNRRMERIEADAFLREFAGAEEARRDVQKKRSKKSIRARFAAETIRRIYAALLARAGEAGLPRQIAETPYEFLPRLERAWHDQSSDLRHITDAYVAVHYAEHSADDAEVKGVRAAWEQVAQAIKRNAQNVKGVPK